MPDSVSSSFKKYHSGEETSLWHCSIFKEMWFVVSHDLFDTAANMLITLSELVYGSAWILDMWDHPKCMRVYWWCYFFQKRRKKKYLWSVVPFV